MSQVRVKICGIKSFTDLLAAVDAGADAVGFVVDVPQSPRNLPISKAERLMKATPIFVKTVVVMVPRDLSHLEKTYKELNPDVIQVHDLSHLHGEMRDILSDARLIGAIQRKPDLAIDTVVQLAETFDAILLDSHAPGKYGGTGRTHDWEISKRVRDAIHPKPLILAGGLRAENIKEAICAVKPYAVDVSSGVESSPGVKDRKKVLEFVKRAKEVE